MIPIARHSAPFPMFRVFEEHIERAGNSDDESRHAVAKPTSKEITTRKACGRTQNEIANSKLGALFNQCVGGLIAEELDPIDLISEIPVAVVQKLSIERTDRSIDLDSSVVVASNPMCVRSPK